MEEEEPLLPRENATAEAPLAEKLFFLEAVAWAMVGIFTAFPIFIPDGNISFTIAKIAGYSVFSAGLLYAAFKCRELSWMREKRGWFTTGIVNLLVSFVTIGVGSSFGLGLLNVESDGFIVKLLSVCVAIVSLMVVGKPIFDFGTVQYFLRLPVQMTIVHYKKFYRAPLLLAGTVCVLILGSFIYPYSIEQFQKNIDKDVNKELREKNVRLKEQLEKEQTDMGDEKKELSDKIVGLEEQLKKKQKEWRDEKKELADEIVGLKEQLAKEQEEKTEAEKYIEELKKMLGQASDQVKELQQQLETIKSGEQPHSPVLRAINNEENQG